MTAPGLILAGPRSGVGKTTITLAVLAALARRGIAVRAAKAGPDYIDPAFHAAATGAPSVNLDSWAMPPALLDAIVERIADGAEMLVIEGVMGLFAGVAGAAGRTGATADIARRFRLPVLLVLDVAGQSQSAARWCAGSHRTIRRADCRRDPEPCRQRAASCAGRRCDRGARHSRRGGRAAQESITAGAAPRRCRRRNTATLPRVSTASPPSPSATSISLELSPARPGQLSAGASALARRAKGSRSRRTQPSRSSIRISSRAGAAGAEIVTFSPLNDRSPPESCDCCWLPGGYPELHAGALASADSFRSGSRASRDPRSPRMRRLHGARQGLEDADRVRHAMTGLLGRDQFRLPQAPPRLSRGGLLSDVPLGPAARSCAVTSSTTRH
jgi:cobyrinic acid a,c-diamide synthase